MKAAMVSVSSAFATPAFWYAVAAAVAFGILCAVVKRLLMRRAGRGVDKEREHRHDQDHA